tara:strand:+ start:364 stop:537 length:174 start_codon:yes stop_codon:yes gene_type:complete
MRMIFGEKEKKSGPSSAEVEEAVRKFLADGGKIERVKKVPESKLNLVLEKEWKDYEI